MQKKDFVKVLAEKFGGSQVNANDILNVVFISIKEVMESGDVISIPKFGKFFTATQNARTCRNPQTGDPIEVPEKRIPKFKASSALKECVLE